MDTYLKIRLNAVQLSSIDSFYYMNGGLHEEQKDVYFLRIIGYQTKETYAEEIQKMDRELIKRKKNRKGGFLRIKELPMLTEQETISFYSKTYETLLETQYQVIKIKYQFINKFQENTYLHAIAQIEQRYQKLNPNVNASILKNFIIKLMYWSDFVFPALLENWTERISPKFIYYGKVKKQEYLFLYFLTQMGCDVCYLNPKEDILLEKEWLSLSALKQEEKTGELEIPNMQTELPREENYCSEQEIKREQGTVKIILPERNRKKDMPKQPNPIVTNRWKTEQTRTEIPMPSSTQPSNMQPSNSQRRELSFEELATLASSVVMIGAFDRYGKCFKTGSGVMVSKQGYILTNNHVASEGAYYCVRIEGEEQSYRTDEIIKYNTYQDLALIRIDRACKPIPIYNGKNALVRGQKVVAIGSPLGLFNSVSDGIISGFRNFDDVNMIQFTAPTSHGSSGGAVLNMYGEVIGISSAGIDEGQNINLAVDYTTILPFIRGFL